MEKVELEFIGEIISNYKSPEKLHFACENGLKTSTLSRIIINKKYSDGLYGLEKFSHIFVLYLLDKANKIELTTYPGPLSIKNLPKVGVFASRSQYRPNHIALRLVKLIKIEKNEIIVEGLDAINGTKVLDIKPYINGFDRPKEYFIADWYNWLN